jgi:N-acetylmuramic acid 6-phosphate etherase
MPDQPLDLTKLLTEQRNSRSLAIDELPTKQILALMNAEDARVPVAVAAELAAITGLVDAVTERLRRGGRLIYAGAGTSGRLGVLDASECPPTFGTPPEQVVGLIAGGDRALRYSLEEAEDNPQLARDDLIAVDLQPRDFIIGIAASGRTPYTVAAVAFANSLGAGSGCITNSPASPLAQIAAHPVVIPVGPELITGSTRLKSGTAQKMVLNMISTTVMINLGKVYGNLMVDVQPQNEKLQQRAVDIIVAISGVAAADAASALQEYGSVKAAVIALLTGLEGADVQAALTKHGGRLKEALQASNQP